MHTLQREGESWAVGFMTDTQFSRLWSTESMLEAMTVVAWLNGGEEPSMLIKNIFKLPKETRINA